METKTAVIMCQIRRYESHGAHIITIPKDVVTALDLQKGDMVTVTITPAMRPNIK